MNRPDIPRATPRIRRTLATLAAIAALGLTAHAGAQPGPRGGHDGGGGEDLVARTLLATKASLNLNTSQQQAWDAAVAQSRAAFDSIRANRQQLKTALQAELAKPAPDLVAIAAMEDQVLQQNIPQRVAARNHWLNVYAMLSPEQKAIVRDAISARLARMEGFRERMKGRHHAPGNG
ncbi:MAG: Spy/CpxP family protein refolding chaperone [Casimicrobiaceae bacterium]